jgi:hypothetical protein
LAQVKDEEGEEKGRGWSSSNHRLIKGVATTKATRRGMWRNKNTEAVEENGNFIMQM